MLDSFCVLTSHLYILLGEVSIQIFCPLKNWIVCLIIKFGRRNINNHRYADDTTLMAESEEEVKNLLMKVKRE